MGILRPVLIPLHHRTRDISQGQKVGSIHKIYLPCTLQVLLVLGWAPWARLRRLRNVRPLIHIPELAMTEHGLLDRRLRHHLAIVVASDDRSQLKLGIPQRLLYIKTKLTIWCTKFAPNEHYWPQQPLSYDHLSLITPHISPRIYFVLYLCYYSSHFIAALHVYRQYRRIAWIGRPSIFYTQFFFVIASQRGGVIFTIGGFRLLAPGWCLGAWSLYAYLSEKGELDPRKGRLL